MSDSPLLPPARRSLLLLLSGFCALLLMAGCASTGGGHSKRDSTLSQASKEAEKKPEDQKKLPVTHDEDTSDHERDHRAATNDHGADHGESHDATVVRDNAPSRKHAGIVFGGGTFGGGVFHNFAMIGLQGGWYANDRARLDLTGMCRGLDLDGHGTGGLKNSGELLLDITARGYLTPPHTFVGAYVLAGLRAGYVGWDYRNPIQVVEEHRTRTVGSDGIGAWGLFTGFGLSPVQFRHLHLGMNLTGGVQFFGRETSEGFDNDLLPTQGFLQFMVELSILGR